MAGHQNLSRDALPLFKYVGAILFIFFDFARAGGGHSRYQLGVN